MAAESGADDNRMMPGVTSRVNHRKHIAIALFIVVSTIVAGCTSGATTSSTKTAKRPSTTTRPSLVGTTCTLTHKQLVHEANGTLACTGDDGLLGEDEGYGYYATTSVGGPCNTVELKYERKIWLECRDGRWGLQEDRIQLDSGLGTDAAVPEAGDSCQTVGRVTAEFVCDTSKTLATPTKGAPCLHAGDTIGAFTCGHDDSRETVLVDTELWEPPAGYTEVYDNDKRMYLARKFLDRTEFQCPTNTRCWGLSVITKHGCPTDRKSVV